MTLQLSDKLLKFKYVKGLFVDYGKVEAQMLAYMVVPDGLIKLDNEHKEVGVATMQKQKYNMTCKFCGTTELMWDKQDTGKWELVTKEGNFHKGSEKCKASSTKEKAEKVLDEELKEIVYASSKVMENPCQEIDVGKSSSVIPKDVYGKPTNDKEEVEIPENIEKIMNSFKKNLSSAKKIYQPVMGSSSSSLYFVVARFTGLNFALRLGKEGGLYNMSMRVEGEALKFDHVKDRLDPLSFKNHGSYRSLHLVVPTWFKVEMVVGAVIGLFKNISLDKETANLEYLLNKGK